ncbi:carbohydrate kinase [Defluviimonas sp. 20V17]|uniref:Carbohydrate kinase n=1 Tax=Allgaiera indica TaxID=765699 RepID=A0AAN4UVA7_9RHOB|nr:carbohydrate kinase [Allgaiera indica]KDB04495.1 carbohydrate kinase [Defluviimonas sp. 20V17]GHE06128.1 carbohydrate kinase [Allgaiera indica]SDX86373.1 fructokinase [Allgaiera indica]
MILCCGEALIDMIPTATVAGPEGFVPHAGGAIFNTAVALGRLEIPVAMLTGLSTDLFGQKLRRALAASNVATDLAITSDRPTTLAFVELRDGHATYHFYDENSAGRMIQEAELPALPDDVEALYFGGISLPVEPCGDTYAALCAREGQARAVMIDPNIRPGFIRDAGRFRARLGRMLALADIVKVSDEDLAWLIPGARADAEGLAALAAEGPKIVVVTRGAQGAIARLPSGRIVSVPSRRATVVDTVGAGDTFNAGLLARLSELGKLTKPALAALEAEALEEALAFGARVAAVTVSRAGANPPWRHELAQAAGVFGEQ